MNSVFRQFIPDLNFIETSVNSTTLHRLVEEMIIDHEAEIRATDVVEDIDQHFRKIVLSQAGPLIHLLFYCLCNPDPKLRVPYVVSICSTCFLSRPEARRRKARLSDPNRWVHAFACSRANLFSH